ncbi:very short patch repair endonuclease [Actinoplanes sichuanensis]|uniref:Very short patch repair endonuclease n=1 Tax=Actinoplanes sichuanensis TaxID=512349 RepID=A0ABW4ASZ7_9ACTN|nr:very short patch repair endonuclease [Actinoplanes sichuanensis]
MSESSWASSAGVRKSMQANTGRDTKPELALRRAVHSRGLRYFVNRRPIKAVRRTADLVFPRIRLAVFLDGCFWHGCPTHHTVAKTNAAFWADKVATNRRRDLETNTKLTEAGWTVVRIWEHEAIEQAADRIVESVADLRRVPSPPDRAD